MEENIALAIIKDKVVQSMMGDFTKNVQLEELR